MGRLDSVDIFLDRLESLTEDLAQAPTDTHTLARLLEAAADLLGGKAAVLALPEHRAAAFVDTDEEDSVACEIGPASRIIWEGELYDRVFDDLAPGEECSGPIAQGDDLILPGCSGAIVIKAARVSPLEGRTRGLVRILGNLVDATCQAAYDHHCATRRAEDQEKTHKQLLRQNMVLRERSMVDELTGLYNRRFFERSLAYELERFRRYAHPIGVLLFDIDFFKKVNDAFGHAVGDMALRRVSEVAKQTVRTADLIARHGGEEFAALLPETNLDGAAVTAERLRKAVAEAFVEADKTKVQVTVSVGVGSIQGECDKDAGEIVRVVDAALYRAKESGRNRVEIADFCSSGDESKVFSSYSDG